MISHDTHHILATNNPNWAKENNFNNIITKERFFTKMIEVMLGPLNVSLRYFCRLKLGCAFITHK